MTISFGRLVSRVTDAASTRTYPLALEDVESGTGRLIEAARAEYSGGGIAFLPGDLLFGRLRPYLAKTWVADRHGEAVGEFDVLRPSERLSPRYGGYLLLSEPFLGPVVAATNGAKMPRADWDVVRNVRVSLPSVGEQVVIADYLDRETAQIDALIGKQERLIETLRERRDATWAEAYATAGGEAAEVPLRRLIESITDGPFGSALTSAHYADAGVRVIRLGNIGLNQFRHEDAAYISPEYASQLSDFAVRPGDVVVAGLGDDRMPLGRAATIPDIGPAIVKADCFRVRPGRRVSSAYLAWAMSAPQVRQQVRLLARGATRSRLNTSVIREVRLRIPTATLQENTLRQAAHSLTKVDDLIAKADSFIALARERRAALITAAVTGQIDVRKAA